MKTHEDLSVYKKSLDLVEAIYKLTRDYPSDEKFGLISQMRRCAVSVPQIYLKDLVESPKRKLSNFFIFRRALFLN